MTVENISNGTCYWKAGEEAADNFIPCGNAIYEYINFPCCNAGDKCLSSHACYHDQGGITYLAGCTDPDFTHESCQDKGEYADQQWVGLVNCDGFTSEDEWAGCNEAAGATAVESAALCNCLDKEPLFTDAPVLKDSAVLPSTISGEITWLNGYHGIVPTAPSMPTTTGSATLTGTIPFASKTSMATATTSDNSAPTGTHHPGETVLPSNSQGSKGLTTSTKAGIGAGAAIAGILLIGCLVLMALSFRRRKRLQEPSAEAMLSPPSNYNNDESNNHGGMMNSTPWTGFKAELAADSPTSSQHPESTATMGSQPAESRQYMAYNPQIHGDHGFRNSNVSDLTSPRSIGSMNSAMSVSPQHTGHEFGQAGVKEEVPGAGRMPPIAELQG